MDGLELLQNLRQSGNNIPFIMFTGKGREEVAMEALNRGANYYLQKGGDVKSPYGTLAHVIREEVDKKRTENKLAEIEKGRQIILDSVSAMMFWIDKEGNFIRVNKAFAASLHKYPGDIAGKSLFDLYPEDMARKYHNDNVKVMESGTPKIEIGYRVDGEETVFFVRDNGIGIDESQHEKVFELFYQVEKSSKGTGAGLAIVKRIIEVHNGRIWIESEKGKGCTVYFTLPVV